MTMLLMLLVGWLVILPAAVVATLYVVSGVLGHEAPSAGPAIEEPGFVARELAILAGGDRVAEAIAGPSVY